MTKKNYYSIVESCERDLDKHGDNYLGVGWTKKQEYAELRYQIMLDLVREQEPATLLDIGCGLSHLYEYKCTKKLDHIAYSGLDLSPKFLAISRRKHPDIRFYDQDILAPDCTVPKHDYVLMNGLFNLRAELSFEDMWAYCQQMILKADQLSNRGFAFNVMSKYLDWERDDLFHLAFDPLASFLDQNVSRYFSIQHDYGLFEYTVYVYKDPLESS